MLVGVPDPALFCTLNKSAITFHKNKAHLELTRQYLKILCHKLLKYRNDICAKIFLDIVIEWTFYWWYRLISSGVFGKFHIKSSGKNPSLQNPFSNFFSPLDSG